MENWEYVAVIERERWGRDGESEKAEGRTLKHIPDTEEGGPQRDVIVRT